MGNFRLLAMVSQKANAPNPSQLSTGVTWCMATGLGPRYFFPERGTFSQEALVENSLFPWPQW